MIIWRSKKKNFSPFSEKMWEVVFLCKNKFQEKRIFRPAGREGETGGPGAWRVEDSHHCNSKQYRLKLNTLGYGTFSNSLPAENHAVFRLNARMRCTPVSCGNSTQHGMLVLPNFTYFTPVPSLSLTHTSASSTPFIPHCATSNLPAPMSIACKRIMETSLHGFGILTLVSPCTHTPGSAAEQSAYPCGECCRGLRRRPLQSHVRFVAGLRHGQRIIDSLRFGKRRAARHQHQEGTARRTCVSCASLCLCLCLRVCLDDHSIEPVIQWSPSARPHHSSTCVPAEAGPTSMVPPRRAANFGNMCANADNGTGAKTKSTLCAFK